MRKKGISFEGGKAKLGEGERHSFKVGQLTVGQLTVGQLTVGQLTVGQLTVGQLTVGQLTVGQFTVGQSGRSVKALSISLHRNVCRPRHMCMTTLRFSPRSFCTPQADILLM